MLKKNRLVKELKEHIKGYVDMVPLTWNARNRDHYRKEIKNLERKIEGYVTQLANLFKETEGIEKKEAFLKVGDYMIKEAFKYGFRAYNAGSIVQTEPVENTLGVKTFTTLIPTMRYTGDVKEHFGISGLAIDFCYNKAGLSSERLFEREDKLKEKFKHLAIGSYCVGTL